MATREKILQGYIEFELLNGRSPNSVFELTKKLKTDESNFYEHFGSLDVLRAAIVTDFMEQTLRTLDEDPNYDGFTAREKLLALFYTLFEQLKTQRSYLLSRYSQLRSIPENSREWKGFIRLLNERADIILNEARELEEVHDRPLIGQHFSKGYQLIFAYLFRVWLKDDSEGFVTTDAAIEKTVNLSFDMLGTSPLDSLLDFGKFALKTKVF
jgi:AcrR family transcriptional regulator